MLPDLRCLPLLLLNQRVHVHDNLHLLCKLGVSLLQYFYSKRSRKMAQLLMKKRDVTPTSEELKWEDSSSGVTPEE